MKEKPFWETKSLAEMNRKEWESLCDGCARCCLYKLEDEETEEVHYTRIVCDLMDAETCQCTDYENRKQRVPDCIRLDKQNVHKINWLPTTCAYRLLLEGKPLAPWHPLVSGRKESVHEAGVSVGRWAIPEDDKTDIAELESQIIDWVRC